MCVDPANICCIPAVDCRWQQRQFLGVFDLSVDPVNEVACLSIDSRVSKHATFDTPRGNSTVESITGHWATRVSLKSKLRNLNQELKVNPDYNRNVWLWVNFIEFSFFYKRSILIFWHSTPWPFPKCLYGK